MLVLPELMFLGGSHKMIHTFLEKLLKKSIHGYSTNFDAQESIQKFYQVVCLVVLKVETNLMSFECMFF